jgi:hypothetical protein
LKIYSHVVLIRSADEVAKAATVLAENMTDEKTAFSDNPIHAPFQRVFKHDLTVYDWYELPENAFRRRRFGIGMVGLAALRGEAVLSGGSKPRMPKIYLWKQNSTGTSSRKAQSW